MFSACVLPSAHRTNPADCPAREWKGWYHAPADTSKFREAEASNSLRIPIESIAGPALKGARANYARLQTAP